jgi:hypothetical protein
VDGVDRSGFVASEITGRTWCCSGWERARHCCDILCCCIGVCVTSGVMYSKPRHIKNMRVVMAR